MEDTYFIAESGKVILKKQGMLAVPMYKGMTISIHGYGIFLVVDWSYHFGGGPDENSGLHIIVKEIKK